MLRKILALLAWGALALICVASLSPMELRPAATTEGSAISQRFSAYLLLGVLFVSAYPGRFVRSIIFVVVVALGLEVAQQLTQDRHGRLVDAIEKAVGGVLGCCIARSGTTLIGWLRRNQDQRRRL